MSGSLQSAFPGLTSQIEPVETVLTGDFDDQSALYGVLLQIEGLGLELVEVRHVAQGAAVTRDGADPTPGNPERGNSSQE
ncbi:MAG TPA: hypothetical protein VGO03_21395 [Acidimicrobiia bacterium]|jgi:hypothetical protein